MDIIINFLYDWGYLALFICMALENMNVPIPSEIILGFAGFLVSQEIFSFWPTIAIGTAAGIAGSVASYYMGYKGGRGLILKHTAKGGLTARKMIAAKDWFEIYGGIAIFTGRLLPGVRTFISLPAGIHRPYDSGNGSLDDFPRIRRIRPRPQLAENPGLQAGNRTRLRRHFHCGRPWIPFIFKAKTESKQRYP